MKRNSVSDFSEKEFSANNFSVKKFVAVLFLIVTLIIPQLGCVSNEKNVNSNPGVTKTGFFLDTVCKITIYGMSDDDGRLTEMDSEELEREYLQVITDSFKICTEYEKKLSKTIEGSDIDRINKAGGKAVSVDSETIEIIKKGIEFGDLSGGVFDITIGKATDLWDFHDNMETGHEGGEIPSEASLKEAVTHINYNNIKIDGNKVALTDPETEINLGGIAKGYIADKVAEYLMQRGVVSGIVDLGGNIVVIGAKSQSLICDEEPTGEFSIGIKDPTSETGDLLGILPCKNKTVVTSGTYERYFEVDGKRYHHILDPKTGYPTDTDVISVTIISERGQSADCDGLSTTCLALGMDKGLELIRSLDGFEAIFVDKDGNVKMSDETLNFITQ